MHRRQLLAALAGSAFAKAAQTKRPNILFLFADDQTFASLHAVNNPEVRTPNLDKLVARGTLFTRAGIMGGTVGAVCAPSRAMLMTGQTLFHIDQSIVRPKPGARPFTTLPEQLKGEGYTTFITGKWHNGEKLLNRAFSTGANIFFGGMADHLATPVSPYDPTGNYPKDLRASGKKFSTELFSDSAIDFIQTADRAKPWLCYVAYMSPHDPRMAPQIYADLYPVDKIKVPANFAPEHPFDNGDMKIRDEALAPWPRTPRIVQEHRAAYYAMITHLDAQIGRVLTALETSGQSNNTIIVFAADNGLAVGQHGLLGKQNMYEHSMRVPLIIAGPGLPQNKRSDALVYLYDLYPTLCDLTGTKAAATVEGKSLAPLLRGQQTKVRNSMFHAYRHFQRAVKDDRWKLILHNVNGKLTTQLFDLKTDPLERTNLADKHPDKVRSLTALLKQWMKETDDPANLDQPNWGIRS